MGWELHTWGWRPWAEIAAGFQSYDAAWADLDGWHQGEPPPAAFAGATHLWGWSDDTWLRIRIEPQRCLAAVLTTQQGAAWPTQPMASRTVQVVLADLEPQDPNAGAVSPRAKPHLTGRWRMATTTIPALSFFRWQHDESPPPARGER